MLADTLTGRDPKTAGPSELSVVIGQVREDAKPGKVRLVDREREGAAYVETWEVFQDGRNIGTFKCYDDRRRQFTRQEAAFGSVEISASDCLYVWATGESL